MCFPCWIWPPGFIALERQGDAIATYEKALSLEGRQRYPLALNNLAWLLRSSDPDRALALAEEAHKAAPASLTVSDTLAMILLASGEPEQVLRAATLSEDILETAPDNPAYLLHSAQIQIASGNTRLARLHLEKLLRLSDDFPGRQEAQALLSGLE